MALLAGRRWLLESRAAVARAADWLGTALLTAGLLTLLLALIRGNNEDGWGPVRIVALFAVAAILLVGFLVREASAAQPDARPGAVSPRVAHRAWVRNWC